MLFQTIEVNNAKHATIFITNKECTPDANRNLKLNDKLISWIKNTSPRFLIIMLQAHLKNSSHANIIVGSFGLE